MMISSTEDALMSLLFSRITPQCTEEFLRTVHNSKWNSRTNELEEERG
jgi:hypothetical protein